MALWRWFDRLLCFQGLRRQRMRQIFAKRFHIHTILTCHQPGDINLSQNTSINESLIIARRYEPRERPKPPTRIISLDRMPTDDQTVAELHDCLAGCETGLLSDGWGEVSEWSVERIEAGDWTAGVFRAPELAEAAFCLATNQSLLRMEDQNMVPSAVLLGGGRGYKSGAGTAAPGVFPVLSAKAAEAQVAIRGVPDQHWAPTRSVPRGEWVNIPGTDGPQHPDTARLMNHASHLLVTAGQDTGTGRLTAVAQEERYPGLGWLPVPGVTLGKAKAAAVFLNSTAGRLQLLRNPGRKLAFPQYNPAGLKAIRLPDLADSDIIDGLARCWGGHGGDGSTPIPQRRVRSAAHLGQCRRRRLGVGQELACRASESAAPRASCQRAWLQPIRISASWPLGGFWAKSNTGAF